MARFAITAAAALAALGMAPAAALADASMCFPGDAPLALFSMPGIETPHGGAPAPVRSPDDEREIMWCAGADDPRCSPAAPVPENGSFAPLVFPAAGLPARPQLGAPTWTLLERTSVEGQPLAGVRQRVERPPRG